MTPSGLATLVPLFTPNTQLLRALRRSDSRKFEVYYHHIAVDGAIEIVLVCHRAADQPTFAPNVKLVGTAEYSAAKPRVFIAGEFGEPVACEYRRAILGYDGDEMLVFFRTNLDDGLNLRPRPDNKLRQVRVVTVVDGNDSVVANNADFRRGDSLREINPSNG